MYLVGLSVGYETYGFQLASITLYVIGWSEYRLGLHRWQWIVGDFRSFLNATDSPLHRQHQRHANVYMMTSSNGNIFRVTGPLCGEFTGPGEFPAQRPVTRSFDVFFDLRPNKRLSKQS